MSYPAPDTPIAEMTLGELLQVLRWAQAPASALENERATGHPLSAPQMLSRPEAQKALGYESRAGFLAFAERSGIPKRLPDGREKPTRTTDGSRDRRHTYYYSRELRDARAYTTRQVRHDLTSHWP